MSRPYRAIIVGDVRLYCEGLAQRLLGHRVLTVVGTATDVLSTYECVRTLRPDVILLDASARSLLAIVPALRSDTNIHVVAFAVGDAEGDALACAEAGVSAFVARDASLDDLVDAVVRATYGELTLSPRMAGALFRQLGVLARPTSALVPRGAELTSREVEILSLVRQGCSNKEIASRLGIRLPTVKNHVHHLLEKLGVSRRGQAAAFAGRSR